MNEEFVKIVEYQDIGKVSFIRKRKVRNLKITVRPNKGIIVTVPLFISMESAGRFVDEKRTWIKSSQMRLKRFERNLTHFNAETQFRTREHILLLRPHQKATIRTEISQGQILLNFPDFADISDPRIQKAIRKAIVHTWRLEAQKYLPERIRHFCTQFHLEYEKLTVRDNRTRWGSCSRSNNINLNLHLMRLPVHLSDYVILHELAHTVHKHHQRSFWQFLDVLTGGKAKQLDKELNDYSPEVW